MKPWTVMSRCLDSGKFTIVGFGTDYMLVTVEDDCPGCISGGGIQSIAKLLGDVNIVFAILTGSCGVSDRSENHLWLREAEARKLFPEADQYWWKTQRSKPLTLKTFAEVKQGLADGLDLTPIPVDTTNRYEKFEVTGNTMVEWSDRDMFFRVMPDGGAVEIVGDKVKFVNFGYRYIEGCSPIRFDPETVFDAVAVEFSETGLSFIEESRGNTYRLRDLRRIPQATTEADASNGQEADN